VRPLPERLLEWFDRHGRHDLPWQHPRTPYRVWVSEIMLQQTQVATVVPYFERFTARFPDCAALAGAPLDEVLHHWSGLGYYARARNLHAAAQHIVATHGGELPATVEELQALPGIGRSTAGAILALGGNARHAILDGNVKRVLSRHFAIAGWPDASAVQRRLWALADSLTPAARIADYTQAIMDLGATVCTRSAPRCPECPLRGTCEAAAQGLTSQLPSPRPARPLPERACRFLLLEDPARHYLLVRRPSRGIWARLWGFPELAADADATAWCRQHGLEILESPENLTPLTHTFTHFKLHIAPWRARVARPSLHCGDGDVRAGVPAMTSVQWLWYNVHTPARVGLAAPVSRLLDQLALRP
jgi:A/G-specific adenine glycosylase